MPHTIWIADDDPSIRFVLERALAREQLTTRSFCNAAEVLEALAQVSGQESEGAPQVLISDIRMPGSSGLELLERVQVLHPGLPVIIMTAYSDLDSAVAAFQRGAFEYLPKPFDVPRAVGLVRRALQERVSENVAPQTLEAAPEMLGQARAMQDVFRAIGRLRQSQVTVLITGESGSGKELVAPSPVRKRCAAGALSRPRAVRCFWMKLATCRLSCRRGCCACCRTASSTALVARPACVRGCGWWPLPTRTWSSVCGTVLSAKTCCTG